MFAKISTFFWYIRKYERAVERYEEESERCTAYGHARAMFECVLLEKIVILVGFQTRVFFLCFFFIFQNHERWWCVSKQK